MRCGAVRSRAEPFPFLSPSLFLSPWMRATGAHVLERSAALRHGTERSELGGARCPRHAIRSAARPPAAARLPPIRGECGRCGAARGSDPVGRRCFLREGFGGDVPPRAKFGQLWKRGR